MEVFSSSVWYKQPDEQAVRHGDVLGVGVVLFGIVVYLLHIGLPVLLAVSTIPMKRTFPCPTA